MSEVSKAQSGSLDSLLRTKLPALGIDVGGTKIAAGTVNDCKLIGQTMHVPTPKGPDKIIEAILNLIAEFQKDNTLAGVGIATAGVINCDTGEVLGSTPNIPGWTGTQIKRIIEGKTMLPVAVDNDANAACYGEAVAKGLQDKTCVVAVTLGTGIGGGIMFNGKMYRGANWTAGEIGHFRISRDNSRLCNCGNFDCWEVFGSGRGLVITCHELLKGKASSQTSLANDPDQLSVATIIEAAQKKDIVALGALEAWHNDLTSGLVAIAQILNPDSIIISGGMSKFVDFDLLKEKVTDKVLATASTCLDLHRAELGENAGLIGGAQQVLDRVINSGSQSYKSV